MTDLKFDVRVSTYPDWTFGMTIVSTSETVDGVLYDWAEVLDTSMMMFPESAIEESKCRARLAFQRLTMTTVVNETVCQTCPHTFFDHEGWIDDPVRVASIKKHRTIGCRIIGCQCPSFGQTVESIYRTWEHDGD